MSLVLFAEVYALADNSPRENVNLSCDVSLNFLRIYRLELAIRIVYWSTEALNSINVNLIEVVTYDTLSSSKVLYASVVVSHTIPADFSKCCTNFGVCLGCCLYSILVNCNALVELCLNLVALYYEVDVVNSKSFFIDTALNCYTLLVSLVLEQDSFSNSLF